MTETPQRLFASHADTLHRALAAIAERDYWSAYPESPSPRVYGPAAAANGAAAFHAQLANRFVLDQPGADGWVQTERSPFGVDLAVSYPHSDPDALLVAAGAALPAWREAGPQVRTGVCLEVLSRLHANIFELANAVQFTTGQAFVMAFQAGGAHALDRALEAIAYGYAEMTRHPSTVTWTKPSGKGDSASLDKTFHVVPRGVALVIGCNTFPTWNSYPGLFASLVTGNPVVVKPHPRAVLPLALTVRHIREVLAEAGFEPNLALLAPEAPGERLASALAVRPEVRIVDFTGSTEYGDWLEEHCRQAVVYTEKAGVNTVVVDSTDNFAGMCRNLAFSLTLYSGQMCTTPQNILIPRDGIATDRGHKSFAEVTAGIAAAVDALTADPQRAVEVTGAIVNDGVLDRLAEVTALVRASTAGGATGQDPFKVAIGMVLDSRELAHPAYPKAIVRTPLIVRLDAEHAEIYGREWFGPISFVIGTDSTQRSVAIFRDLARRRGALTGAVYSTNSAILDDAEKAALETGVNLSCNLTGGVFVNQSAAFSDFHATGANPAANAALTDGAYVSGRFRVVASRRPRPS